MTRRQCGDQKALPARVCRRPATHIGRIRLTNGLVQFEKIGCQACVEAWAKRHEPTAYETTITPIADTPPLVATTLADGTQGYIPSPTFAKVTQ